MPFRYFLNGFRAGSIQLSPPKAKGTWTEDPEFLLNYAMSVDVSGHLSIEGMAHSIPSVFQRPIQFHYVLGNPENPLHHAVTSEWRGLLALVCLSNWLGLEKMKVDFRPFVVPNYQTTDRSEVGNENCRDLHFRAALRNQLPLRPLNQEEGKPPSERSSDWDKWWMIYWDGKLLGATSPWSMVYTAAQYQAPNSIPWQKNGLLIDPIQHYDPDGTGKNVPELAILHAWVTFLTAQDYQPQWGFPNHLGQAQNILSVELQAWKRALEPYGKGLNLQVDEVNAAPLGTTESSPLPDPYGRILRPAISGWGPTQGDVYVATKNKQVLMFYSGMAPGLRVDRGVLASRIDVASLRPSGSSFETIDGLHLTADYIVPEKLFFADKIVEMDLSNNAFGTDGISTPLTPEFFKYFGYRRAMDSQVERAEDKSPKQVTCGGCLADLHIERRRDAVTASLSLILTSGQIVKLSRTYRRDYDEIITLPLGAPGLALWPDKYDPKWMEPFAAVATATDGLTLKGNKGKLLISPLLEDATESSSRAGNSQNERKVRVWKLDKPAIGFALLVTSPSETGSERAGLILRKELAEAEPISPNKLWQVGVDFGTSSTTVMYREGLHSIQKDSAAKDLEFSSALLPLVGTDALIQEIDKNLYPRTKITPPFRTLLYEAEGAASFFPAGDRYSIRFESDILKDLTEQQPIKDLKWGTSNALTKYLEALTRYIVWKARSEGVKTVEFTWSYPTSLPARPFSDMSDFWQMLGNKHPFHPEMSIKSNLGISESVASCQALTDHKKNLHNDSLTITVDVGGGSTDIAFWKKGELLDQVSFKLAGNDVLDGDLLSPERLAEVYKVCTGETIPFEDQDKLASRKDIFINGALASEKMQPQSDPKKHPFCGYILDADHKGKAPWIQFRSMAYLFFTGICYYMGVQTRQFSIAAPEIDIYFGGRGSAMLTWLSPRADSLRKLLEDAFRIGLLEAPDDGIASNFVSLSPIVTIEGQAIEASSNLPKLKVEVATGLLTDTEMQLSKKAYDAMNKKKGPMAGEIGWSDPLQSGNTVAWNQNVPADFLLTLKPPPNFASTFIGNFLHNLLEDRGRQLEHLNLDSDGLKSLNLSGTKIAGLISIYRDSHESASQPIFAYELKYLMQQYAEHKPVETTA